MVLMMAILRSYYLDTYWDLPMVKYLGLIKVLSWDYLMVKFLEIVLEIKQVDGKDEELFLGVYTSNTGNF